jgi:hypothetical protein
VTLSTLSENLSGKKIMSMRPYSIVLILSSIFFISNSLSNTVMAQQRAPSPKEPQAAQQTIDPETAQRRLVEGNRRFVQNQTHAPACLGTAEIDHRTFGPASFCNRTELCRFACPSGECF